MPDIHGIHPFWAWAGASGYWVLPEVLTSAMGYRAMSFRSEPRESDYGVPFQIVRCRPGKPITGVFLSRRHEGADLHYWKRRSTLCAGNNCEPCREGYRPRWYGYAFILRSGIGTICILEFTARCWPSIREYYETVGDLRGAKFNASRLRSESNSPMAITISEEKIAESSIPKPDGLREMLSRIWEVRTSEASNQSAGAISAHSVEQARSELLRAISLKNETTNGEG